MSPQEIQAIIREAEEDCDAVQLRYASAFTNAGLSDEFVATLADRIHERLEAELLAHETRRLRDILEIGGEGGTE